LTQSQTKKTTDQSDNKPYLLVQYPSQGRHELSFLNIKNPRFDNPRACSNKHKDLVHISAVIEESMLFILNHASYNLHTTGEID